MATRLTNLNRILLGCLGAVTPMILNLYFVDFEQVASNFRASAVLGYGAKATALLWAGGVVAALHKDENTPFRLFELGMLAPALIIAMLNGNLVGGGSGGALGPPVLTTVVHAYSPPARIAQDAQVEQFSTVEETPWQAFWRGFGLRGTAPRNWFVIVDSNLELDEAKKRERKINAAGRFRASVFAPYGASPFYSVVIGANLTQAEARLMKQQAVESGLSEDPVIWSIQASQSAIRAIEVQGIRVDGQYRAKASTLGASSNATVQVKGPDEAEGSFKFEFHIAQVAGDNRYRIKLEQIQVYEDASLGSTRWLFEVHVNGKPSFTIPQRRYSDDLKPTVYRPFPDYAGEAVEVVLEVPEDLSISVIGFKPKDIEYPG